MSDLFHSGAEPCFSLASLLPLAPSQMTSSILISCIQPPLVSQPARRRPSGVAPSNRHLINSGLFLIHSHTKSPTSGSNIATPQVSLQPSTHEVGSRTRSTLR